MLCFDFVLMTMRFFVYREICSFALFFQELSPRIDLELLFLQSTSKLTCYRNKHIVKLSQIPPNLPQGPNISG